jgi:hypothetical protein
MGLKLSTARRVHPPLHASIQNIISYSSKINLFSNANEENFFSIPALFTDVSFHNKRYIFSATPDVKKSLIYFYLTDLGSEMYEYSTNASELLSQNVQQVTDDLLKKLWSHYVNAFKKFFINPADIHFRLLETNGKRNVEVTISLPFEDENNILIEKKPLVLCLYCTEIEDALKRMTLSLFHSYMKGTALEPKYSVDSAALFDPNLSDDEDDDGDEDDILTEETFWKKQSSANITDTISMISKRRQNKFVEFDMSSIINQLDEVKGAIYENPVPTDELSLLTEKIEEISRQLCRRKLFYNEQRTPDGKKSKKIKEEVQNLSQSGKILNVRKAKKLSFKAVANAVRASEALKKRMTSRNLSVLEDEENKKLIGYPEEWNFDVFRLDWQSKGKPLSSLLQYLSHKYELIDQLKIDQQCLQSFLRILDTQYGNNPFHNSTHAADVLHGFHYLLDKVGMFEFLTANELFACLLAAAIHDFRHPGVSNLFLITTRSELALRYNDKSVLENYHCASTFELLNDKKYNFLSVFDDPEYKGIRETVCELVLATDLSMHQALITQFVSLMQLHNGDLEKACKKKSDKLIILKILIKAADISNPTKPPFLYLSWVKRLQQEFFLQGEKEKGLGLPYSPFCNPNNCDFSKCQQSFIDYIVNPMYSAIVPYLPMLEALRQQVQISREFWSSRPQVTTLSELDKLIEEEWSKLGRKPSPCHFQRQTF